MSYDRKCYELARDFLGDEPYIDTTDNRDDLAQSIQDAIENTIWSMKEETCDECGHVIKLHDRVYGCEFERGDAWITGNQPEAPIALIAQGPCGCKALPSPTGHTLQNDEARIAAMQDACGVNLPEE